MSCSSGTSHSHNQWGGTRSDCLMPRCRTLGRGGGGGGRKGNVCDRLEICSAMVHLRVACAWGMPYVPTSS